MPITPDKGTRPQGRQRLRRFNSEKFQDALATVYVELGWLRSSVPVDDEDRHELRSAFDALTDAESTVLEVAERREQAARSVVDENATRQRPYLDTPEPLLPELFPKGGAK